MENCAWLVCQRQDEKLLLERMAKITACDSHHRDNEVKEKWVPERDSLVLEKVTMLMTDNARALLDPKDMAAEECDIKSLNFSVKQDPMCYFI